MPRVDAVEGLVRYVEDVKPYHTKILEVLVEYIYEDTMRVKFGEELEWTIDIDHDRALGYCPDGFGLVPFGELKDGGIPTASDNNTNAESNWDTGNCPPTQEGLIFPTIDECHDLYFGIENMFCSDWSKSTDRDGVWNFVAGPNGSVNHPSQVVMNSSFTLDPVKPYVMASPHFYIDHGRWYYELAVDQLDGDCFVGFKLFDPIVQQLPFDLVDGRTAPLGEDTSGNTIEIGINHTTGALHLVDRGDLTHTVVNPSSAFSFTTGDVLGFVVDMSGSNFNLEIRKRTSGSSFDTFTYVIPSDKLLLNSRNLFPEAFNSNWMRPDVCDAQPLEEYVTLMPIVMVSRDPSHNTTLSINSRSADVIMAPPSGYNLLPLSCMP